MHSGTGAIEALPTGVEPQPVGPGDVAKALFTVAGRAVVLALLWPLRIAGYITARLLRLYVHYYVQVSNRAKCPACGVRTAHDVRWSDEHSALIHLCKRCFAVWNEQPMVRIEAWRTTLVSVPDGEDVINADGTRTTHTQHAQREPQLSYAPTGRRTPVIVQPRGIQ